MFLLLSCCWLVASLGRRGHSWNRAVRLNDGVMTKQLFSFIIRVKQCLCLSWHRARALKESVTKTAESPAHRLFFKCFSVLSFPFFSMISIQVSDASLMLWVLTWYFHLCNKIWAIHDVQTETCFTGEENSSILRLTSAGSHPPEAIWPYTQTGCFSVPLRPLSSSLKCNSTEFLSTSSQPPPLCVLEVERMVLKAWVCS